MWLTATLRERLPRVLRELMARYGLLPLVPTVVVVALLGLGAARNAHAIPAEAADHVLDAKLQGANAKAPAPADVFMQALIAHNGQLAWQQLCPTLQQKLPA